jgi:hypothetical protein
MKANRFIILSFFTLASSSLLHANEVENTPIVEVDSIKTAVVSNESSKSSGKLKTFMKKANPSLQFGGFIVGKYSIDDKRSESKSYNNSFDMRYLRLYANGYCFDDFYYRFQLEVNGSPGDDKGPRLLDAFVEWQKYDFAKIKLGQFKRPFGFENPYSPLNVGHGSYSQISTKLASLNDRIGEHKSNGRDVGIQLQGDLFKSKRGHHWLHYQVGLFNGQGINHADKDNFKDLIGGLWFSPIKDLCIGGFGWNGRYTNESYNGAANTLKQVKRVRWGAGLKYESKYTVRAEYMASYGGVTTNALAPTRSDGWYATVGIPVVKDLKLYARWDCYRDAKTWESLQSNYGISANYTLGKHLIFQANYAFTDKRGPAKLGNHYNTFDFQVYARF